MVHVDPDSHVGLHLSAPVQSMVQFAPVQVGSQSCALVQSIFVHVDPVSQVGVHLFAPLQSTRHVLPLPQLAPQSLAPPHSTSQLHAAGHARFVQSPPLGHAVAVHWPPLQVSPLVQA
jgi:hypothetical protein